MTVKNTFHYATRRTGIPLHHLTGLADYLLANRRSDTLYIMKIMIVDDEAAIREALGKRLKREGFETILCADGAEALRRFQSERPEIVVLDIVMPNNLDGLTVCRRIREVSDIPIIMLSAQAVTEEDIVTGLMAGADDYLEKPIGLNEFAARIHAVRRRALLSASENDQQYDDKYLTVDLHRRTVYVQNQRVHLTPIEFKLLAVLMENAGRVVSQRDLLEQVWGKEYIDDIYYPRVYISQLRRKIERDASAPQYILTEHRVGYRFERPKIG